MVDAALICAEQSAIRARAVLLQVISEQLDQLRRDRYRATRSHWPPLEAPRLVNLAIIGPVPATADLTCSSSSRPQPVSGSLTQLSLRRLTASDGRNIA